MGLISTATEERRDYIRMQVNTAVTLKIGKQGSSLEGWCSDISGSGMMLVTDRKLAPGTRLEVSIPSESPAFQMLKATVEVVRSTPSSQRDRCYDTGAVIHSVH